VLRTRGWAQDRKRESAHARRADDLKPAVLSSAFFRLIVDALVIQRTSTLNIQCAMATNFRRVLSCFICTATGSGPLADQVWFGSDLGDCELTPSGMAGFVDHHGRSVFTAVYSQSLKL
jgi:hypothetical protein